MRGENIQGWNWHAQFIIAQSAYRWAKGWNAGVLFPAASRNVSLLHSVQTSSGAHPASYPMGMGGSFPKGEAARA
jgi:hypothetical protein